ncbi:hypothetical protein [Metabacillus fastidiosus]|uniref:hypothetical protein n=1 Tax=Metabacillus fastidiosus TaxID=1458 RepID=UPI003D2900BD
MNLYSKCYLLLSLTFIVFNGSSIGFIIYCARLGELFGTVLFHFTALLGALCASIADDGTLKKSYYQSFFFYTNLIIFFLPYFYFLIGIKLLPLM